MTLGGTSDGRLHTRVHGVDYSWDSLSTSEAADMNDRLGFRHHIPSNPPWAEDSERSLNDYFYNAFLKVDGEPPVSQIRRELEARFNCSYSPLDDTTVLFLYRKWTKNGKIKVKDL